jgi:hypothetical protein
MIDGDEAARFFEDENKFREEYTLKTCNSRSLTRSAMPLKRDKTACATTRMRSRPFRRDDDDRRRRCRSVYFVENKFREEYTLKTGNSRSLSRSVMPLKRDKTTYAMALAHSRPF